MVSEVEFLRPQLAATGRISTEAFETLVAGWKAEGAGSLFDYLARRGCFSPKSASTLRAVMNGYVDVPAQVALRSFRLPLDMLPSVEEVKANVETGPRVPTSRRSLTMPAVDLDTPAERLVPVEPAVVRTEPATVPPLPAAQAPAQLERVPVPPSRATLPPGTVPTAGARATMPPGAVPTGGARSTLPPLSRISGSRLPAAPEATPGDPKIGQRIGRYILEEVLGTGSTAVTFRAYHDGMGVPVAIKVFRGTTAVEDPDGVDRFFHEARTLARIDHPNVVRVLDVDMHYDSPYIVFEYVGAMTLADLVGQSVRLPGEKVAKVGIRLAAGLGACAQGGIVHRDVKPANVLLKRDGNPKIADFGFAIRPAKRGQGEEEFRGLCGSPAFMAPEQIERPDAVDFRADMYALGCTLHFAATGKPPFVEPTVDEVIAAHLNRAPPAVYEIVSGFSLGLASVILQLLDKRPEERFSTWRGVIQALTPYAGNDRAL